MNVQKRRRGHKTKEAIITEKLRPIIPDELKKEKKKTCIQALNYVPAMVLSKIDLITGQIYFDRNSSLE